MLPELVKEQRTTDRTSTDRDTPKGTNNAWTRITGIDWFRMCGPSCQEEWFKALLVCGTSKMGKNQFRPLHVVHLLNEQGLSSLTQYRLYGRRFYRSQDPTNSIKVLKETRYKNKENPEKANNTKYSN